MLCLSGIEPRSLKLRGLLFSVVTPPFVHGVRPATLSARNCKSETENKKILKMKPDKKNISHNLRLLEKSHFVKQLCTSLEDGAGPCDFKRLEASYARFIGSVQRLVASDHCTPPDAVPHRSAAARAGSAHGTGRAACRAERTVPTPRDAARSRRNAHTRLSSAQDRTVRSRFPATCTTIS